MEKKFKELYDDMLSNLNLETKSDLLSDAIGIKESRMDELKDSFLEVLKSSGGENKTRSSIWAAVLYHVEPKTFMELFALGTMLGAFEFHHTIKESELQSSEFKIDIKSGQLALAALNAFMVNLDEAKEDNDWEYVINGIKHYNKFLKELVS